MSAQSGSINLDGGYPIDVNRQDIQYLEPLSRSSHLPHNTLHCNRTDHNIIYNRVFAGWIIPYFFNRRLRVQFVILLRTAMRVLSNLMESLRTFMMEDQSVILSRVPNEDKVPSTTAFILASISVKSGDVIRTTNSAVVVSDTPYRLMASVILQGWPWVCFEPK